MATDLGFREWQRCRGLVIQYKEAWMHIHCVEEAVQRIKNKIHNGGVPLLQGLCLHLCLSLSGNHCVELERKPATISNSLKARRPILGMPLGSLSNKYRQLSHESLLISKLCKFHRQMQQQPAACLISPLVTENKLEFQFNCHAQQGYDYDVFPTGSSEREAFWIIDSTWRISCGLAPTGTAKSVKGTSGMAVFIFHMTNPLLSSTLYAISQPSSSSLQIHHRPDTKFSHVGPLAK